LGRTSIEAITEKKNQPVMREEMATFGAYWGLGKHGGNGEPLPIEHANGTRGPPLKKNKLLRVEKSPNQIAERVQQMHRGKPSRQ